MPPARDVDGIPLPQKPKAIGQTHAFLRGQREHMIEKIRAALAKRPPGEEASPGFVIPAEADSRILMAVFAHLRGKPNPFQSSFREGEFTLVFFSHPLSYYTRLREVKREADKIIVRYQFEPHTKPEATAHFALIPLGKLPGGEYHVDYQQIPLDQKYREMGFEPIEPEARQIVPRDFSFKIIDLPSPDEPAAEAAHSIPLDQIWAYHMAGTRDVRELEPQHPDAGLMSDEELLRTYKVRQILKSLSFRNRPKPDDKAGPAFVVVGTGKEALKNARDVFVKEKEPAKVLPADTDLTLIFYSYMCARYVRLTSGEQSENAITVKYEIVAHGTHEMTTHFALIPIGKLNEGTVQVKVKQVDSNDKYDQLVQPLSNPLRYVSGPFTFEVRK
jgi:hypothetical protein